MKKQIIYLGAFGAALSIALFCWQQPTQSTLVSASLKKPIGNEAIPTPIPESILINTAETQSKLEDAPNPIQQKLYRNTFASTSEYQANTQFGELPPHMRDVKIEELGFDTQGNLVIDGQVKNVIEFFLLAQESEGLDQAIARLKEYLSMTLPSSALEQALEITDKYLAYKQSLSGQQFSDNADLNDEATLSQIKLALDERKRIRQAIFGKELSEAIFGYEEAYENYSYTRLTINASSVLSDADKEARITETENQLPPKLAEKMRYQRHEKQLQTQISALKKDGHQEEQIYELRKAFYGDKVADRLAYLEETSPEWQQRVEQFFDQKAAIQQDDSMSETEKAGLLRDLTQQSFSYKEQVKLAVQQIRG